MLIVDDDEAFRELAALVLEQHGVQVTSAADGSSGLVAAFTRVPGLVITDLEMPGIGGVQMIRSLRCESRTIRVPVVVMTGASQDVIDAARQAGCTDVVPKPCSPWRLVRTVNRYVGRRREDHTGGTAQRHNRAAPDRRSYSRLN